MVAKLARRVPYPTVLPSGERDAAIVAMVLNNAVEGNLNVIGDVTILASSTETRIDDPRISAQSLFVWQALSAAGATLIPSLWFKQRGVRFAVFGHAAPAADVELEYAIFG
jgi:hypothetical protein